MTATFTTRPARKSDASDIALLVNIAAHGGMARGWAQDKRAAGTYEPLEVGRLDMLRDDTEFAWRNVTMAEADGEIAGMLLGYREPDALRRGAAPMRRPSCGQSTSSRRPPPAPGS